MKVADKKCKIKGITKNLVQERTQSLENGAFETRIVRQSDKKNEKIKHL